MLDLTINFGESRIKAQISPEDWDKLFKGGYAYIDDTNHERAVTIPAVSGVELASILVRGLADSVLKDVCDSLVGAEEWDISSREWRQADGFLDDLLVYPRTKKLLEQ